MIQALRRPNQLTMENRQSPTHTHARFQHLIISTMELQNPRAEQEETEIDHLMSTLPYLPFFLEN